MSAKRFIFYPQLPPTVGKGSNPRLYLSCKVHPWRWDPDNCLECCLTFYTPLLSRSQFFKMRGSGSALFRCCFNREVSVSVDMHPNDGLAFIHSWVERHLPFPFRTFKQCLQKDKNSLLSVSVLEGQLATP